MSKAWTRADRADALDAVQGFLAHSGRAELPEHMTAEDAAGRYLDFLASLSEDYARSDREAADHARPGDVWGTATAKIVDRLTKLAAEHAQRGASLRKLAARVRAEGMPGGDT